MKLSSKAEKIFIQFNDKNTKLGDIRKIANEIKKDHNLACNSNFEIDFVQKNL